MSMQAAKRSSRNSIKVGGGVVYTTVILLRVAAIIPSPDVLIMKIHFKPNNAVNRQPILRAFQAILFMNSCYSLKTKLAIACSNEWKGMSDDEYANKICICEIIQWVGGDFEEFRTKNALKQMQLPGSGLGQWRNGGDKEGWNANRGVDILINNKTR